MPNLITLAKTYVPLLDEVYKNAATSSVLDANQTLVRMAANGKDILVAKVELQGLGDTTRGGDYVDGDVTLVWETISPDWDRNRKFTVDSQDNAETAGLAFGVVAGEFIRSKVAPELDAYRYARYASTAMGNSGFNASATITTRAALIAALKAALNAQDEAEVPVEGRILVLTHTMYNLFISEETTESKEVLTRFSQVVRVPQTRFYTAITLLTGKLGQEAGGYAKRTASEGVEAGKDINFLIVHPSSVVQTLKHVAPKIITPELNQKGDNWAYAYRAYGLADTFENKIDGIYVHHKA